MPSWRPFVSVLCATILLVAAHGAFALDQAPTTPKDDQPQLEGTKPAAGQGDPAAQCAMASQLLRARGAANEVQAAELATRSANAGDSCGQQLLGSMYMRGQGVPKDLVKGIQLTRLAADKGHAAALFDLGLYYESGEGVTQDFSLARTCWEAALAKGHTVAAVYIGNLYANGQGVEKDGAKALSMWRAVAEDKSAPNEAVALAAYKLGLALFQGWNTAANPTEAKRWMTLAAGKGHPKAAAALSVLFAPQVARGPVGLPGTTKGNPSIGIKPGKPDAFEKPPPLFEKPSPLFGNPATPGDPRSRVRKAADAGDAAAQTMLAGMYFLGRGVEKNEGEAARWLQKAADQNYVPALTILSNMYANGRGVPKDPMKALALRARIPPDQRKDKAEPTVTMQFESGPPIHLYMSRGGMRFGN